VPHPRLPRVQIRRIYIGEFVARNPLLLQTLLGSYVAVCLRDPIACIGRNEHILLPGRSGDDRFSRFWSECVAVNRALRFSFDVAYPPRRSGQKQVEGLMQVLPPSLR
jgi:hypothetical protein